ncbi:MAG TPA: hypothetical protein VIM88_05895 [Sulfurovum sp.]|uniref:hypothetical protein n=1 Tax=Sulfurovum sp. TaxID=1969726 RepID=UPI002F934425
MVKHVILSLVLVSGLYAENVYERNCVECHKTLPTTLQQMFKRYLLVYSAEEYVKAGLKHYLRYPSRETSVMPELFIDTYGIKKRTNLSESDIDEALDIYWNKFKVFDKLK